MPAKDSLPIINNTEAASTKSPILITWEMRQRFPGCTKLSLNGFSFCIEDQFIALDLLCPRNYGTYEYGAQDFPVNIDPIASGDMYAKSGFCRADDDAANIRPGGHMHPSDAPGKDQAEFSGCVSSLTDSLTREMQQARAVLSYRDCNRSGLKRGTPDFSRVCSTRKTPMLQQKSQSLHLTWLL